MMAIISVALTDMSYINEDTTHIRMEFLKCKWKMFCEVWQNLQNDNMSRIDLSLHHTLKTNS